MNPGSRTTTNAAVLTMHVVSIVAVVVVATLHRVSGRAAARPISFELAEGNVLAWLLILLLVIVVGTFVRRLVECRYVIRTYLLSLAVPCLLVIAATPPRSPLHDAAFALLTLGVGCWFVVMAAEGGKIVLLTVSAGAAFALPLVGLVAPGTAQKFFIAYALLGANWIYLDLEPAERVW